MCKFLRSLDGPLSVLAFLFGHFIFDSYAAYLTLSFDTLYVYFQIPFFLIVYSITFRSTLSQSTIPEEIFQANFFLCETAPYGKSSISTF